MSPALHGIHREGLCYPAASGIGVCQIYFEVINLILLTLVPQSTPVDPYSNSLDLDSASHQDPSCLTIRPQFQQLRTTLEHFEN